jgi:hypothetical protein
LYLISELIWSCDVGVDQEDWALSTEAEAQKSLNGYIAYLRRQQQGQKEFGPTIIKEGDIQYTMVPESLLPDSQIRDSLIPDSQTPDSLTHRRVQT